MGVTNQASEVKDVPLEEAQDGIMRTLSSFDRYMEQLTRFDRLKSLAIQVPFPSEEINAKLASALNEKAKLTCLCVKYVNFDSELFSAVNSIYQAKKQIFCPNLPN